MIDDEKIRKHLQHLQARRIRSTSAHQLARARAHTHKCTRTHPRAAFNVFMCILICCTPRQMLAGLMVVCLKASQ